VLVKSIDILPLAYKIVTSESKAREPAFFPYKKCIFSLRPSKSGMFITGLYG
jgi:hypothetical protein